MSKRRKKKKKGYGMIVFLSLIIVACLAILFVMIKGKPTEGIKNMVTEKVTEQVMEQMVQKALETSGDPQAAEKAQEIVDGMEEQDKQAAQDIIEKYADGDTLSDCMDIISDGVTAESLSEVEDYLRENVEEEDQAQLEELYRKYSQGY